MNNTFKLSRRKPTKPGWYWMKRCRSIYPSIVHVDTSRNRGLYYWEDHEVAYVNNRKDFWSQRIPEPEGTK